MSGSVCVFVERWVTKHRCRNEWSHFRTTTHVGNDLRILPQLRGRITSCITRNSMTITSWTLRIWHKLSSWVMWKSEINRDKNTLIFQESALAVLGQTSANRSVWQNDEEIQIWLEKMMRATSSWTLVTKKTVFFLSNEQLASSSHLKHDYESQRRVELRPVIIFGIFWVLSSRRLFEALLRKISTFFEVLVGVLQDVMLTFLRTRHSQWYTVDTLTRRSNTHRIINNLFIICHLRGGAPTPHDVAMICLCTRARLDPYSFVQQPWDVIEWCATAVRAPSVLGCTV